MKLMKVITAYAVSISAKPELAFSILANGVHIAVCQTIFGSEIDELFAFAIIAT
jgi:hypothetical protein